MTTRDFKDIETRMFPNTALSDRWLLTFSNIPTLDNTEDMRYFDSYIKSFLIPDYSIEMINTQVPNGFTLRHPLGGVKANQDLQKIVIEFKLSEDYLNYITIMKWIYNLKYGETNQKEGEWFRDYVCKAAKLQLLDNQKRPVAIIKFSKLLPSTLGSLQLTMGTSQDITFAVSFSYEEISYELVDIMTGSFNPSAPEVVSPCGVTGVPLNPTGIIQTNN